MGYKQLDFRKRCQIYGLWRAGHNQSEITKDVDVHKSTISRELKLNIKRNINMLSSLMKLKGFVHEKLLLDWNPDQISGYAKRHNLKR